MAILVSPSESVLIFSWNWPSANGQNRPVEIFFGFYHNVIIFNSYECNICYVKIATEIKVKFYWLDVYYTHLQLYFWPIYFLNCFVCCCWKLRQNGNKSEAKQLESKDLHTSWSWSTSSPSYILLDPTYSLCYEALGVFFA